MKNPGNRNWLVGAVSKMRRFQMLLLGVGLSTYTKR